MGTFSMRCEHCKAELKMKSQGFYILVFALICGISGGIFHDLSSFLVKTDNFWIRYIVFLLIIIIFGFIFVWFIWKFWKVIPRNGN